jgi:hypothetical protein
MADRKNQHYVPKMLLKRFGYGEDNRQIDLLNVGSGLLVRGAPVKNQCSKDYFYDKDGELEGHLGYFEGRYAKLIRQATETGRYDPAWHNDLATFVSLQKTRTYQQVEAMELGEEKMMKLWLNNRVPEETLRSVRIRKPDMPAVMVRMGFIASLNLLDLKQFLVVNRSAWPFMMSDTPVIETNRFIRQRYPLVSTNGLSKSGLQLFIPIGPRHGFLLHDSNVYTLPAPGNIITLKRAADVDLLNRLQWLNAYQNLYVPPGIQEAYVREITTAPRGNEPLVSLGRFEMVSEDHDGRKFGGKERDEYALPTEGTERELAILTFKTLPDDIRLHELTIRPKPLIEDSHSAAGPSRDSIWEDMITEFRGALDADQLQFQHFRAFVATDERKDSLGPWFTRADHRYLYP